MTTQRWQRLAVRSGLAILTAGAAFGVGLLAGLLSFALLVGEPGQWLWRAILWAPLALAVLLAARSMWTAFRPGAWMVWALLGGLAGFAAFWTWLLLSLQPGD